MTDGPTSGTAAGGAAGTEPEPAPVTTAEVERETRTLLEQMGGLSGLVFSSVPVLVFVVANTLLGLTVAIWAAVGSGVAVAGWRLLRRQGLQPAVSGLLGVAVAAFIAHRTGTAKGFFLLGIWTSLVYGGVLAVSVLARWPLVGVIWSVLNGHGQGWREHRGAVRAYDVATLGWTAVFAARFVVQQSLYGSDRTGWLAAARLGMGWPLTGLALLLTAWAVRRAGAVAAAAEAAAPEGDREPETPGAGTEAAAPEVGTDRR